MSSRILGWGTDMTRNDFNRRIRFLSHWELISPKSEPMVELSKMWALNGDFAKANEYLLRVACVVFGRVPAGY